MAERRHDLDALDCINNARDARRALEAVCDLMLNIGGGSGDDTLSPVSAGDMVCLLSIINTHLECQLEKTESHIRKHWAPIMSLHRPQ